MTIMSVSTQSTFDDLELLAQVSLLWTEVNLNHALKQVVKLAAKSVGAVRASLFIQESDKLELSNFIVGTDDFLPAESEEVLEQVIQNGLAGWVLRNEQGAIVDDTTKDDRWYRIPGTTHQAGSALSVPFKHGTDLLGVITLVHDQPYYFTQHHLRLLTVITNQMALAVHNAQTFQQVKAQQAQMESVLQAIPDILLVLDETGKIVIASDAADTLLDGHNVTTTLENLKTVDLIFTALQEGVVAADQHDGEWTFETRSEKTKRDFAVHIIARSKVSQEKGHIIVMNEVTALRNLSRFKDAVLRLVSHELRTPLIVITGYADLLEVDLVDDPAKLEYVRGILEASERMDKMLGNMLRVEKLRSTPAELNESVNLRATVAEITYDLLPLAAQKEIDLQAEITDDPVPNIQGNAMLLRQAMENFVSNAIKYTPQGGQVFVRAYREDDRFCFVVRDTGIGINHNDLTMVFESYYRGQNADSQSTKGMGLGLSLVKSVITQHGGNVWVESEENQGSTFGLWLTLK
jgi:signal transduction histidine kinase